MNKTLQRILTQVSKGEVRISDHGYDELAEDNIYARDIIDGVREAIVVEDYPDYPKGSSLLVLQKDQDGKLVHVAWGIPRHTDSPAVVITAFRPDSDKWANDFLRKKQCTNGAAI